LGGQYVPCAALFHHEPGLISAVALSRRVASSQVKSS
jgi:hypothetical protein